jgi:hypothetical protein
LRIKVRFGYQVLDEKGRIIDKSRLSRHGHRPAEKTHMQNVVVHGEGLWLLLASTSDIALERRREKLWNRAYIIGHPALRRMK